MSALISDHIFALFRQHRAIGQQAAISLRIRQSFSCWMLDEFIPWPRRILAYTNHASTWLAAVGLRHVCDDKVLMCCCERVTFTE